MANHLQGTYVLQALIENKNCESKLLDFIAAEIEGNILELAKNPLSINVLKAVIENENCETNLFDSIASELKGHI